MTGRDVHLFQDTSDARLDETGLSAVLISQFKRELLSPSVAVGFFLKLKARRKPAVDELPLETRGDWINAFALMLLLGGI